MCVCIFESSDSDTFLSPPEESDDENTIELEEKIQVEVCIRLQMMYFMTLRTY